MEHCISLSSVSFILVDQNEWLFVFRFYPIFRIQ